MGGIVPAQIARWSEEDSTNIQRKVEWVRFGYRKNLSEEVSDMELPDEVAWEDGDARQTSRKNFLYQRQQPRTWNKCAAKISLEMRNILYSWLHYAVFTFREDRLECCVCVHFIFVVFGTTRTISHTMNKERGRKLPKTPLQGEKKYVGKCHRKREFCRHLFKWFWLLC